MPDNSELANIKFIPPEISYSVRKPEIYSKFKYFAKIASSYISDPQITKELEVIENKLQS